MKQNYFLKLFIFFMAICSVWQVEAQTYTFTPAGASGRTGPTQPQVDAAYVSTSLDGQVTINTQGIQEWTVPVTGSYSIEGLGGQGGRTQGTADTYRGFGASISGEFFLTAGQIINIVVGQEGLANIQGNYANGGGFGGGGSFTWITGNTEPLVAAGGGGGGSIINIYPSGPPNSLAFCEGKGGDIGLDGSSSQSGVANYGIAGGDASQGSGSAKGWNTMYGSTDFSGQGFGWYNGMGGFGGGGGAVDTAPHAGGGGGGYSGGGGGQYTLNSGTGNTDGRNGGGGGGSYNAGTNQINTAGANAGNGQVVITLLCDPLNVTVTPGNNVCPGTMVTITGTSPNGGTITWDNGITNGAAFTANTTTTYTSSSTDPNDCVATVVITAEDTEDPVITCPADITRDNDAGVCGAFINISSPSIVENCSSGSSLNFDGTNDALNIADGFATDMNELTIEANIFIENINNWDAILNTNGWFPGGLHFQIYPGGQLGWSVNGNSPVDQSISPNFNTNQWYHIAVSYSSTKKTVSFYIDGNLIETKNYTSARTIAANSAHTIGSWNNSRYFDGNLDEIRIWDNARTQAEIQATMNIPLTGNEAGLLSLYNFEEGTACADNSAISSITDLAGGDNNGVLTNFTLDGSNACQSNFSDSTVPNYILTNDFNNTTDASDTYPVGTTTVTWTVTDASGNTAQCEQTVTVADNETPTAKAQEITVQLDVNGQATITPAQINNGSTDNCTADGDLVLSLDKTEFSCADVGGVNSALDLDGGDDYISITNPYSQFSNEITVSWWVNFKGDSAWMTQSTENVDNMNTNVWLFHASSANGINWYVNDGGSWKNIAGNTTAGWHMVTGTANALATRLYIDGVLVNSTSGISSGIRNNTNSVIQIGKDGRFPINSNRSSRFDVDEVLVFDRSLTQVEIETLKTNAPELNNVNLKGYWDMNENTGSTINDKSVTGANGILENMDPLTDWIQSGSSLPNGNLVALTVTDASGNESTSNAVVTVEDNVAAEAIAKDITVQLDETGNVEITAEDVDNGSNDACGIESMSVSLDSFTCSEVGDNTVTLTVIDNNGNESTATSTVTVEDNVAAIALAKDITVQLDETGNVSIPAADVDNGSNDACGIQSMSVSPSAFTCAEVGDNTVTLTVIDNNGNESTTTSTVSVEDNVAAIAIAKDITVQLDETGNVSITAADVDNGSNDACGIQSMRVSPNAFTCSEVGDNTVTLTVIDNNGNESTITSTVTVEDNVAAIAMAKDITVQLDATGNVSITAEDVDNGSNDACGIKSMSVSPSAFTCAEVGDNTVTLTVIDNNDNESTITSTVTVEDNVAAIALAKDITVQLDETGNVSITAADVDNGSNDACGIQSMSVSPSAFTCSEVGDNTVTLTVIDNNGNESTITSTVSVEDNVAPVATAKNITVQLDATGNVSITAADVDNGSNDACGIASMSISPSEFTCAEVGDNTVTLTVIDNNGNESNTTSTVSVEDNVAAIAMAKDITVQLDETGNVSITAAEVDNASNDACGIQSMSVSPSAFTCAEVGDNTVTLTVIDNNGNESTTTSTVSVEDNVAAIAMAKDITVQLDETGNVSITAADVDNGSNDACGIQSMSVSPAAFTCAEVGDNTVTLTVIDNNGNESTATSTVTVEDNVAPVAMAKDITVQLDETGNVSITAADVDNGSNDACGIASMSVSPNAFTCAEVGANTVTLTVIDNNGNESTTTSIVTVEDNVAAIAMAKDITVQLEETGNVSITAAEVDNGSNDACGIESMSVSPDSFTCAEVGDNTVTLTVIDNNGNESTTTSTVTVEDNVAAIAVAKDITVQLDETGNVSITAADVDNGSNDACGIKSMSVSPSAFTCAEVGENTVTLTVVDNNGNESITTSTVIVEDSIKPIPSTTTLPEITAVCEVVEADVTVPTATDNCGGVVSVSHNVSFPITTQGLTVITWSFEDANGNIATQTQDVMLEDTTAPVPDISELESIIVECEAINIEAPTATDICGGSITGTTLDPMSYTEEGEYMILWEFNDGNGNVATQEQWVTVKDNTAPQINTQDLTITVGQDEPAVITPEEVNDGSTDNCSEITFTLDRNTFDKPGVYEVVLTGTDASGNTSQATATIKVKRGGADPMEVHVVPTMLTGTSIAKVILPFRGRIMEVQVIEVETNNYKVFDGNKKNVMEIDVAPMKGTLLVKILDNEGNFHLTKLIAL